MRHNALLRIACGLFLALAGNSLPACAGDYQPSLAGTKVLRDLAYGEDEKQKIDVYLPSQPNHAPIIVMVHGGAWRFGDKSNQQVVVNKVEHWLPKGFIFISVNNRLLPANPLQQAADVAAAMRYIQSNAMQWGGDPSRIVLMGHSAGAHLVALLSANPASSLGGGVKPWRGTVSLDSGGVDVESVMDRKHFRLYDEAFGSDREFWRSVSPIVQLKSNAVPMLLVCSSERTDSCPVNYALAEKAQRLGVSARVLEQAKSHREINEQLGEDVSYTAQVDDFIRSVLDKVH